MAVNEKKIKFTPITSVEVKSSFNKYISAIRKTRRVFDFHNTYEYILVIRIRICYQEEEEYGGLIS